jgi:hypothetical protein
MTAVADLISDGEVRIRVDDDGIASWERHDGLSFGYGPGSLWHVRVRKATYDALRTDALAGVSSWVVLVDGDSADEALDTALWHHTNAVADIVDGPVDMPDVDEAILAGLQGERGYDGPDAGDGPYDGPDAL